MTTAGKYILLTILLLVSFTAAVSRAADDLGSFDGQTDVGSPGLSGSANYDPAALEYSLAGAGTNMWFTTDQCHFLWKKMKGDFILRARLEFIGPGKVDHRKAGWMVRSSLDTGSPYADCAEHGSGLTSLQFRRAAGRVTEQIQLTVSNADVLQFERRFGNYIFSAARNGETFSSATLSNLDLGDDVYAGLYVCSHSAGVLEKAVFRDVRIIRPPKIFVPYRDYIGSALEILDVQTGRLETVYHSDQPFEAPNWTRDGAALIYNNRGHGPDAGRLCRFDLAARTPSLINTGACVKNNNDHVLSFDGQRLAISDQSLGHGGKSSIFTLPAGGGIPTDITPFSPSYCHGWSPDGKFLVYTGGRNGKFDIYKISSGAPSDEIRLTDAPGLNDGPEYTPDGSHIYFNSTRRGSMQLWRMDPDGQNPEQVTDDEFNNWFPHISPDGKWIVFVTFNKDVAPDDHPYYKQIYLRLLPMAGGKPKVIAYVYGGQGTMNVPSWSPDSRRIAFVSNTR